MNDKYITLYMDIADRVSRMSVARRLMVGSVIVKNNSILSYGWNGMPSGWDNNCEDEIRYPDAHGITLKTKPEVLHSEMNSLMKITTSTISSEDSIMFCTHAPCIECAKSIYQAKIATVYYKETYRDDAGIKFLTKSGINVIKYDALDK